MDAQPPVNHSATKGRAVRFVLMALNALGGVGGIVALIVLPWASVRAYACNVCVTVTTQWTVWDIIRARDQWDIRFVFGVLAMFVLVAMNATVSLIALRWGWFYAIQTIVAGLGLAGCFFQAIGIVLGGGAVAAGSADFTAVLLFVFVFPCALYLFGSSALRDGKQV